MLTAGGAMFTAFPNWYAALFSGFYLVLFLILIALIVRGAFEFRGKDANPRWRALWNDAIFFGSVVPALVWGVVFGNILRGVDVDASMTYVGSFFDLLNPYALVGGLVTLTLFILHRALFWELKTDGIIQGRARRVARRF